MRIIAGTAKGRTLKVPKNSPVRPTADRVKETVFNVLGQWFEGERVLDLYAGVGGLGLEAMSRGAGHATFVERDRNTLAVLAENIRALGFGPQTTTLLKPVDRAVRQLGSQGATFELVFADPPYADEALSTLLEQLDALALVSEGGRVIVEHDKRESVPEAAGLLIREDERRFGDTTVTFYRRRSRPSA